MNSHGKLSVGTTSKSSVAGILDNGRNKRGPDLRVQQPAMDGFPKNSGFVGKWRNSEREARRGQQDVCHGEMTPADVSIQGQLQVKTRKEKVIPSQAVKPTLTRKRSSSMSDLTSFLCPPSLGFEPGGSLPRSNSLYHISDSPETDLCSTEL